MKRIKQKRKYIWLKLKAKINFDNFDNLIHITQEVNNYLDKKRGCPFVINHEYLENMSIGGMIYLIGQMDKVSKNMQYSKKYGLSKHKERIRFLLCESGYCDYLNIDKPYSIDNERKRYFLSIQSNTISNIQSLNKVKKFISENTKCLENGYHFEYSLDDIIKEAMGNSIEHAYPQGFNEQDREKGKWWICGHYDNMEESLEIVLYDYGVGIRKSLEINLGEEAKRAWLDKTLEDTFKNDADLIEIAINGDLSKYTKHKDRDRGKGLKRFKQFAVSIGYDCELTISSGKGKYKMIYDIINKREDVKKESFSKGIDGMLVKWKIKKVSKNE